MIGATMFSGILAPETAMPWVDWKWCAEIETFPCSVIQYRKPKLPNLGDVNAKDFVIKASRYGPIDVLVAGAPCQDFSVAGQRAGLDGARGSLSLRFVELVGELRPRWLLFENVPGLLSSASHEAPCASPPPDDLQAGQEWSIEDDYETDEGSDFGYFLSAILELGYSLGYTVLDAQYRGLAQRRERVFVVGSLGEWTGPSAVLFDLESLRGDIAPSRETRQGPTADVAACLDASYARLQGASGQDAKHGHSHLIPEVAFCLNAKDNARIDGESETFITCPLTSNPYGDHESRESLLVAQPLAVRRLTPLECERLMGFPDGWTDIPHRGKQAADGVRYRALGNSMAIPVIAWIGKRILEVDKFLNSDQTALLRFGPETQPLSLANDGHERGQPKS